MARTSSKHYNKLEILGAAFLKVLFESTSVDLRTLDLLCENGDGSRTFESMLEDRLDDDTLPKVLREANLAPAEIIEIAKDPIAACIARCLEVKSVKITL